MYKSPESKKLQEQITWLTRIEASRAGLQFKEEKFWVSFMVEKPSNRFDAANVIDSVLDAVSAGIGVNDRWAAISRLDWVIKKTNPMVWVVVEQG